jgi:hypothetical protein
MTANVPATATIQAREWVLNKRFTAISSSNYFRGLFFESPIMRQCALEGLSDRELEHFGLVAPLGLAVAVLGVQRNTEAEPEQTQGR